MQGPVDPALDVNVSQTNLLVHNSIRRGLAFFQVHGRNLETGLKVERMSATKEKLLKTLLGIDSRLQTHLLNQRTNVSASRFTQRLEPTIE